MKTRASFHFAALAALTATTLAAPASAIELYASSPGGVVLTTPVYTPPTVVVVRQEPQVIVTEPEVTAVDEPTHPQEAERRDPTASVFLGGGYGGMTAFRGGAASTYRLHAGLSLGATELGLRADIADRALNELANTAGGVWILSAEVAHRFLQGSTLRPVLGASFDRWQIDPDGRDGAGAFGLGARAGVEVHYQVSTAAALVFGLDLGFHHLLAAVDNASVVPNIMTFGATADIRL